MLKRHMFWVLTTFGWRRTGTVDTNALAGVRDGSPELDALLKGRAVRASCPQFADAPCQQLHVLVQMLFTLWHMHKLGYLLHSRVARWHLLSCCNAWNAMAAPSLWHDVSITL